MKRPIREAILKEFKSRGFLNSRLSGGHPGHTVSVGSILLKLKASELDDFSLGEIGYSDLKIRQLIRGYIQPVPFLEWVGQLAERQAMGSIDADVMFFPGGDHGHERGPCITAMGFRDPGRDDPTLTVFSRSSEFPHKFLADLWLLAGICSALRQLGITDRPIRLNWFISLVWMDARTANYLRVMSDPINPPYTAIDKFNFLVDEQWTKFITSGVSVSFSTLRNLRALYLKTKKTSGAVPSDLLKYLEIPR